MFLVKDRSPEREVRILSYLKNDPALAMIMATIHFEWTVQRAIISLSELPNKEVRKHLSEVRGIKNYKECWGKLISKKTNFPTLINIIKDWNGVIEAFTLRNQLVHGKSSCSTKFASPKVKTIINASRLIREFCEAQNIFLDLKLKIKKIKN